jgi:hypothetical protein
MKRAAPLVLLCIAVMAGCAQHATQDHTTDQSDGHGPGAAALPGSGAGMNQGHAPADTYGGPADHQQKSTGGQR